MSEDAVAFEGGRRLRIEGVRIAHRLRGEGIGKTLLHLILTRARARGCRLVQLTTNKARSEAIRFYESLGFTASHEGMKLDLRDIEGPGFGFE